MVVFKDKRRFFLLTPESEVCSHGAEFTGQLRISLPVNLVHSECSCLYWVLNRFRTVRSMDTAISQEINSRPFLRLRLANGGPAIIFRILQYAWEVVDVFVLGLPADTRKFRHSTVAGPPAQSLPAPTATQIRNQCDRRPSSDKEQQTGHNVSPSWYLVRVEVKLRAVCRAWKELADSNDAV